MKSDVGRPNGDRSTVSDILGCIARIRVPLPAIKDVGALLDTVYDHRLAGSLLGSIAGQADVGKSTAVQLALGERRYIKAVVVNLLARELGHSLAGQIAAALQAPAVFGTRAQPAAVLLARQFELRAIEMLVIDGAEKLDPKEGAEWVELLANLSIRTSTAIVISGRHRNLSPARTLAHSLGRQEQACKILPFPASSDNDIELFRKGLMIFAAELVEIVGGSFNPLELATSDMAARILLASKGRIRRVSLLIQAAVREALLARDSKLTRLHFEKPWLLLHEGEFETEAAIKIANPFSGKSPGLEQIRKAIDAPVAASGSRDDIDDVPRGRGADMYARG